MDFKKIISQYEKAGKKRIPYMDRMKSASNQSWNFPSHVFRTRRNLLLISFVIHFLYYSELDISAVKDTITIFGKIEDLDLNHIFTALFYILSYHIIVLLYYEHKIEKESNMGSWSAKVEGKENKKEFEFANKFLIKERGKEVKKYISEEKKHIREVEKEEHKIEKEIDEIEKKIDGFKKVIKKTKGEEKKKLKKLLRENKKKLRENKRKLKRVKKLINASKERLKSVENKINEPFDEKKLPPFNQGSLLDYPLDVMYSSFPTLFGISAVIHLQLMRYGQ